MLTPEQEQQVQTNLLEAKKLIQDSMAIIKSDSDKAFELKDLDSPDGQAWLEIIGQISDFMLQFEEYLNTHLPIANSFEERLKDNAEATSNNT